MPVQQMILIKPDLLAIKVKFLNMEPTRLFQVLTKHVAITRRGKLVVIRLATTVK
jgi:hypothetical protein